MGRIATHDEWLQDKYAKYPLSYTFPLLWFIFNFPNISVIDFVDILKNS